MTAVATGTGSRVTRLAARAFTVPTDAPESDGTLAWDSTTLVLVEVEASSGEVGLGYTYGDVCVAAFVRSQLAGRVAGADVLAPQAAWAAMRHAIRNAGQPGVGAMALSAVDIALWDLKAKVVGLPLADLLGRFHDAVPLYGSGGFTSYERARLREQLRGWVEQGIPRVKMKVGRHPDEDPERIAAVRDAIGDGPTLLVDANGAFTPAEALGWADRYAELGVSALEEPVTSQDLTGMRRVRDRAPAGMAIVAGEYGWDLAGLAALADCVDVLQADVTRCGGVTSMLRVDALCEARSQPFSAHGAPAVSAHVCSAMETTAHLEWFHDHVRVEQLLFDGTLTPEGGTLRPAPDRPGLGLSVSADAERFAA